jgi:hypothetical protein
MNPDSDGDLADPEGSKDAEGRDGRWVILVR